MAVYLWPGNDGAGNSCRCAGGYFRRHGVNYHSGSNIAEDRVALSAEGNPRSGIRGRARLESIVCLGDKH